MGVLSSILSFVTNPKNREFLLIGTLVIIGMLFFRQCGRISDLNKKNDQNLKALSENTEVIKNKDNEITYQKTLVVGSAKDLKSLQGDYGELEKELKKEKGKVKVITKVEIKYEQPEVTIDNELLDSCAEDHYCLIWRYLTDIRHLEGITNFKLDMDSFNNLTIIPGKTDIKKDIVSINLITGIKTEDGVDKIFIKPTTPGIIIGNITGAIIENSGGGGGNLSTKKPKRISLAVNVGYGPSWDLNTGIVKMTPNISIGLSYSLMNLY
tara:strand:+ start:1916 stop:2716 length:801 start_codon:yes stop_codon:yes gene_type:complete